MFSVEVVVITFVGTRREAKRLRVSSAMCRLLEVHYVSTERLLEALQIAVGGFLPAFSSSIARQGEGGIVLSAVAVRRRQGFGGRVAMAD